MTHQFANLDLTQVEKECLVVYLKRKLADESLVLGASEVSIELGVSRPRAYALQKQLEKKGILLNNPGLGFYPSDGGEEILESLQHRWKVLEMYFYKGMDMELEDASTEAMNILLYVSNKFMDKVCEKAEIPPYCPHDQKIPLH